MARTSTRAPSPTRLEATAWPAGPGRGAGGRQHGQNKHTRPKPHPIGGHRVACGARPRCRRAAAGPGQTTSQRTEQHQRPGTTGVEGAGGTGGHGRGAGGRRQGQGGPRDRPLRAFRLACGDLAGGPPPTGTHSGQPHQGRPHGARKSGGARNTRGATSNNTREQTVSGRAAAHRHTQRPGPKTHTAPGTPAALNEPRHRKRKAYSPRNALIAGISRTACTRPAR